MKALLFKATRGATLIDHTGINQAIQDHEDLFSILSEAGQLALWHRCVKEVNSLYDFYKIMFGSKLATSGVAIFLVEDEDAELLLAGKDMPKGWKPLYHAGSY